MLGNENSPKGALKNHRDMQETMYKVSQAPAMTSGMWATQQGFHRALTDAS